MKEVIKEVREFLNSKGFKAVSDESDINFYSETFTDNKTRIFIKYKKDVV